MVFETERFGTVLNLNDDVASLDYIDDINKGCFNLFEKPMSVIVAASPKFYFQVERMVAGFSGGEVSGGFEKDQKDFMMKYQPIVFCRCGVGYYIFKVDEFDKTIFLTGSDETDPKCCVVVES